MNEFNRLRVRDQRTVPAPGCPCGVPRGARGRPARGALRARVLRGAARGGSLQFAVSASRVENYVPSVKRTYASGTRI